jgi:hypothetical protein
MLASSASMMRMGMMSMTMMRMALVRIVVQTKPETLYTD